MVDECDLFVGLLWERWGQPSGVHSSGFEEEFERARQRRKRDGAPEVWLVFKDVDPAKLHDPGEQLKKVVEFRSAQETRQEVLFKNVRDANDWRDKLQSWLLHHVLGLTTLANTGEQRPTGVVPAFQPPDAPSITGVEEGGARPTIPRQLVALSNLLGQSLQSGATVFSATPDSPMQEFEVARLFLLSSTLMSHRYTREVLGTHEINLLYKHRERLEPTYEEKLQLLRAIVEGTDGTKPGWFWFGDMVEETVPGALFGLVEGDGSEDVRAGALDLLRKAGIRIPQGWRRSLPLDDDSPSPWGIGTPCLFWRKWLRVMILNCPPQSTAQD
jgi:hypothetical protein